MHSVLFLLSSATISVAAAYQCAIASPFPPSMAPPCATSSRVRLGPFASAAEDKQDGTATIAQAEPAPSTGLGWPSFGSNMAVQALYVAIPAFGISILLAPFGGESVPTLLGAEARWFEPIADVFLGTAVAAASLYRGGVLSAAILGERESATLDYSAAQAEQMRPLWEIAGSEPRLPIAVAAIVAWQLSIAVAEELYYRGLVQSGVGFGLGAIGHLLAGDAFNDGIASIAGVACNGVALLMASAVFGLVHTEFVQDGTPGETKEQWFREATTYGLLYGLLFLVSGDRLLAPVCAHAGINVGLCVRDWRRMRRTDAAMLRQVFGTE